MKNKFLAIVALLGLSLTVSPLNSSRAQLVDQVNVGSLIPVLSLLLDEDSSPAGVDDVAYVEAGTFFNALNVLQNDNLPAGAVLQSFGGPNQAQAGDNAVGSLFTTASGAVVSLAANGDLSFDATGLRAKLPAVETLYYLVQDGSEQITAQITINIGEAPVASNGPFVSTFVNQQLTINAQDGLLSNDFRGAPDATLVSFGGGSLGGTVTDYMPGSSVPVTGGQLTVYADGSYTLLGTGFDEGDIDWTYRLSNPFGADDAAARITIDSGPDLPEAKDDSYTATGNLGITVPNGFDDVLRRGDDDLVNGADLVSFGPVTGAETEAGSMGASAQGGQVALASNGGFTYHPPAGFIGTDSFVYTLENSTGSDTATVSITVSDRIWFVDARRANQGDGTLNAPFNSLGGSGFVTAADQAGDLIIVRGGANYVNGITLKDDQTLLGDGINLSFESFSALSPFSNPIPAPTGVPTVVQASTSNALTLANRNAVLGFVLSSSSNAHAAVSGNGINGMTLQSLSIDGGVHGMNLTNCSGYLSVANATSISNVSGTSLEINGGSADLSFAGTITQSNSSTAVRIVNKNAGRAQFHGFISANTAGANAIELANNSGATIEFLAGLNLDTTTGRAFSASGGGTLRLASGLSTNRADSTAGTALYLSGMTTQSGIHFDSLSSKGSPANGIEMIDLSGTGNVTVNTLSILNTAANQAAIRMSGSIAAPIIFGDVDVVLSSASSTALDMSNAQITSTVDMVAFDVQSNSANATVGLNLSNATGAGTVRLGDRFAGGGDATIEGVAQGVVFSPSTRLDFTFGDAEEVQDTGSRLTATTALVGSLPALGSYNFLDVVFPNGLGSSATPNLFYASSKAAGAGDGSSFANAGTLAAAEAANAQGIVVFDQDVDGNASIIDFGADTFDLDDGQVLVSIIDGQTINFADFGLSAPSAPGYNFDFNNLVNLGDTVTGTGIDSVHPVIESSALGVLEMNNVSATLVNVHVRATSPSSGSGIRYLGSGANKSLLLQNVYAESVSGLAINIDPSTAGLQISGQGNQAHGVSTGRALRISDGTLGGSGLGFSSLSTLAPTSGSAVSISRLMGSAELTIASINIAASNQDGLVIKESSAGVTVLGGQLSHSGSGVGLRIGDSGVSSSGGANTIQIGATINSSGATGRGVEITERSGGTVLIAGRLADDAASGGGINIFGTNTGTITFSGYNSAALVGGAGVFANAIHIQGSVNAAVNLSRISATTLGDGNGILLTGAGSGSLTLNNMFGVSNSGIGINLNPSIALPVSGANNQAESAFTGRALRMKRVIIPSAGLDFFSVSTRAANSIAAVSIDEVNGSGQLTIQNANLAAVGAANGLSIENSTADISVLAGQLSHSGSGVALRIGELGMASSGGANSVEIAATIDSSGATGRGVEITERSGGAVLVSGQLADDVASGGGIDIFGTNAGTITFSGNNSSAMVGSSALFANAIHIQGTTNAVVSLNNISATSVSGSGIALTGTGNGSLTLNNMIGASDNGIGINLNPGVALPVSGTNNQARSALTGRALRMKRVTIPFAGLSFSSVNTQGADNFSAVSIEEVNGSGQLTIQGGTLNLNDNARGVLVKDSGSTVSLSNLSIVDISGLHQREGVKIETSGLGSSGTVNIFNSSFKGVDVGIDSSAGVLTLADSQFDSIGSTTISLQNTFVSGSGNTDSLFVCDDLGGNVGAVVFNSGSESCP